MNWKLKVEIGAVVVAGALLALTDPEVFRGAVAGLLTIAVIFVLLTRNEEKKQ